MNLVKLTKILRPQRSAKVLSCTCRWYTNEGCRDSYADVVVVGGGMVGTSLACALANSNKFCHRKVVLLETATKEPNKNWKECPFENRVSSITPGSRAFLENIGVWDKVAARRCYPYQDMFVWDGLSSGNIHLDSADLKRSAMAHMVENSVLVESCMERVDELDVNVKFNAKIEDIVLQEKSSNLTSVKLQNGDVIRTKLVVGADGPNSYVRNKVAQIETMDYDYKQFAVVATLNVKCTGDINRTAWQCFLPTGPIALLPLSHGVSSLVWSTTKENAKELVKDNPEVFVEKINEAVSQQNIHGDLPSFVNDALSKLVSIAQPGFMSSRQVLSPPLVKSVEPSSRGMFPLMLKHSPFYVKSRLALVGDAAHRIHPMAGLGVNLGFGDAECLVRTIESALETGEDFGCLEELLPYETERQRHVVAVVGAITGLHQLFTTSVPPVVLLRTLGMHATNNLYPVKEQVIKYAMQ